MNEDGGRDGRGDPPAVPPPRVGAEPARLPPDIEFITEERLDFTLLSPCDSREEEGLAVEDDDEEEEGAGRHSGRWSPLSGARLDEVLQEATRLALQLERCRLPRRPPPTPAARSPRSPRRDTFVVKDSPVRALLPTVEPGGPPASPPANAAARPGASGRDAKRATSARKDSPGCRPAPKGPPVARVAPTARAPPSRVAPARPCPPPGSVATSRPKSEPVRAGAAGQVKASAGAAPTATKSRARATAVPAAAGRLPVPSAIPKPPSRSAGPSAVPGTVPASVLGAKSLPRASAAAHRGPVAPRAASGAAPGNGCRPGAPASRLRLPRKTALASSSR